MASLFRLFLLLAALPLLVGLTALVFYPRAYQGRVYPGIAVAGQPVGGAFVAEARTAVLQHADSVAHRQVVLHAGDTQFAITLEEAGAVLSREEIDRATRAAFAAGRDAPAGLPFWSQVRTTVPVWLRGRNVPLVLSFDAQRAAETLGRIAYDFDVPPLSARLEFAATEAGLDVHFLESAPGRRVDVPATVERLQAALPRVLDGPADVPTALDLVTHAVEPKVDDAAAAAARDTIVMLAGSPLVLQGANTQSWSIDPAALLEAVQVVPDDPAAPLRVLLDDVRFSQLVLAVADKADQRATEPRLELQQGALTVRPGAAGRLVDREAAVRDGRRAIGASPDGAGAADRRVVFRYVVVPPRIAEADLRTAAEWTNARLEIPIELEYDGQRRTLEREHLTRLLHVSDIGASLDRAALRAYLATWVPGWVKVDPQRAALEPALEVSGGRVQVRPGRPGLGVDLDAVAAEIITRFESLDPAERVIQFEPVLLKPPATTPALEAAKNAALALVGRPVVLYSFAGEAQFTPAHLAAALRFQTTPTSITPVLDREALLAQLRQTAAQIEARAAAMSLRDSSGRPLRVDLPATLDELMSKTSGEERWAAVHWSGDVVQ